MIKTLATLLLTSLFFSANLSAQILENQSLAFQKAKEKNQPILLFFSGSDWCKNCIRFKKEILEDALFQTFCENNLVILKVDFPQGNKQSKELVQQNEYLAQQYHPEGTVPYFLLIDADGKILQQINYVKQSAADFIKAIKFHLPVKPLLQEYRKQASLMGTFFEFIVVDSIQNKKRAEQLIEKSIGEVQRIENLISEWIPSSPVSEVNQNAGIQPVAVPLELYQLIHRSKEVSQLTQGAFDISFLALKDLWKFDGTQRQLPEKEKVDALVSKVGFEKIHLLENHQVFLEEKGMAIGFGGIGQGYAVEQVRKILTAARLPGFVINSSGDVYSFGKRADGSSWKVGIADPFDTSKIIKWLPAENVAIVTSGSYEKYFEVDGKQYSHIINPKTGYPAQGIVSVTIISPQTEIADALATGILVLGKEVGLNLINQLPGTHCIIIDDQKNVYFSEGLNER